MFSGESPQPRLSAHPWSLYQAEHLARRRSSFERGGFYTGMLKDDLRKQRYAYEISFVPVGAEWSRATEVMFALLNDFNHTGYDRDPAAILCDFVDGLLEESTGGKDLLLELHSLPEKRKPCEVASFRPARTLRGAERIPTYPGVHPQLVGETDAFRLSQVSPDANQPAVIIPGSRVHRLRLRSPNLGHWTHAVRELRQVDATKVIGADVDRLSWEGYSFSKVVETQNLAGAATTAPIGWDGRGTFSELVTSPYMAFRRLRFVRFWAEAVRTRSRFSISSRVTNRSTVPMRSRSRSQECRLPRTSRRRCTTSEAVR